MFTFSRLRRAIVAGGIFFAALWIIEDLRTSFDIDRLTRTAISAVLFGVLDVTFGQWFREKWMARFVHPNVRKRIAERNKS
jgi:hypothetical protein